LLPAWYGVAPPTVILFLSGSVNADVSDAEQVLGAGWCANLGCILLLLLLLQATTGVLTIDSLGGDFPMLAGESQFHKQQTTVVL
jgi:hypothetical protein